MKKFNFRKLAQYCILIISIFIFTNACNPKIPKDPSQLLYLMEAEPSTLNPLTNQDAYGGRVISLIYESLIERDNQNLEWVPKIAESWTISENKKKIIFKIRDDVYWQDGQKLTIEDILFTFEKLMDPKVDAAHARSDYLDNGISFKKINEHTLECNAEKVYFQVLETCGGLSIIPKHIFDTQGNFNQHPANRKPIGSGPFVFEKWDTNKRIVLKRNENYWDKRKFPQIKSILFRVITDRSVAFEQLKKQELDFAAITALQWTKQSSSQKFEKNFVKHQYYKPAFRYIGWNLRKKIFQDKKVRQALTQLIDREKLVEKVEMGFGKVISGPFFFQSAEYNSKISPLPYNPAEAVKLLKEAGWEDHDGDKILDKEGEAFRFKFLIPSGNNAAEIMTSIMKEDFSKVGIDMEIQKLEWGTMLQKINTRDFDAVTLAWTIGFDTDPYAIWHSSQSKEGFNFVGFNSKEADDILVKARTVFDKKERALLYNRFHEIVHEEQPYTFLYTSPALAVRAARFKNVKVYPGGLDILEWKLEE